MIGIDKKNARCNVQICTYTLILGNMHIKTIVILNRYGKKKQKNGLKSKTKIAWYFSHEQTK